MKNKDICPFCLPFWHVKTWPHKCLTNWQIAGLWFLSTLKMLLEESNFVVRNGKDNPDLTWYSPHTRAIEYDKPIAITNRYSQMRVKQCQCFTCIVERWLLKICDVLFSFYCSKFKIFFISIELCSLILYILNHLSFCFLFSDYGFYKLEAKTKTDVGAEFTSNLNSSHDSGKVNGSLETKYKCSEYGKYKTFTSWEKIK